MENINIEELLFKYDAALKIIRTKFEIMYDELNKSNNYNCIEHIKSRIKTKDSIYNKLISNGYEITSDNIENHIHDIAGIRIVCSFLSDIEKVEHLIKSDKDLIIKRRKDYVNNPKKTGYSSLHLIVLVPVNILDKTEYVEVEIQIRTIAMDMWASLEHKLSYKSKKINKNEEINLMNTFSAETKKIDNIMEKMIIASDKYNNNNEIINEEDIKTIEKAPILKYELALKKLKTKVESINYELSNTIVSNPIEHIKTRIKKPENIVRKLNKLNYAITPNNMYSHIHDLVGLRIVCSFLSDLEEIVTIIENDPDIKIIKEKNYIENPKENGYRSYHINALIPVRMINKIEYVEVEIQIRTIAMDMWATLEHKICYQKNGNIPIEMKEKLKLISNYINKMDNSIDTIIKNNKKGNKTLSLKKHV